MKVTHCYFYLQEYFKYRYCSFSWCHFNQFTWIWVRLVSKSFVIFLETNTKEIFSVTASPVSTNYYTYYYFCRDICDNIFLLEIPTNAFTGMSKEYVTMWVLQCIGHFHLFWNCIIAVQKVWTCKCFLHFQEPVQQWHKKNTQACLQRNKDRQAVFVSFYHIMSNFCLKFFFSTIKVLLLVFCYV